KLVQIFVAILIEDRANSRFPGRNVRTDIRILFHGSLARAIDHMNIGGTSICQQCRFAMSFGTVCAERNPVCGLTAAFVRSHSWYAGGQHAEHQKGRPKHQLIYELDGYPCNPPHLSLPPAYMRRKVREPFTPARYLRAQWLSSLFADRGTTSPQLIG